MTKSSNKTEISFFLVTERTRSEINSV